MAAGPKIRCLRCLDVIQSQHRHDWVECSCGEVFIDGGSDYTRIGAKHEANYEELKEESCTERPISD